MRFDTKPQHLYVIWKTGQIEVFKAKTIKKAMTICKKRNTRNMINAIYCDGFRMCETLIGEPFKFTDNGVD